MAAFTSSPGPARRAEHPCADCGAEVAPVNCAPWPWYPKRCAACSRAELRARFRHDR